MIDAFDMQSASLPTPGSPAPVVGWRPRGERGVARKRGAGGLDGRTVSRVGGGCRRVGHGRQRPEVANYQEV
ncbi:hypothetical protein GGD88_001165 [Roseospira goensis]|uniref:Uncharacterized protein n=1 Tax=Roseospira goensis TaxID=391922 RepID=A0A7W6RZI8_9PROT|nr:hypothetical protein [Roseospira goensis]